jgi:small-conductance mechanosensitive channel
MPALRIALWMLIAIFFVSIYNLIRGRKFRAKNKPKIFINTMRVILGISLLMLLFVIILDFIK